MLAQVFRRLSSTLLVSLCVLALVGLPSSTLALSFPPGNSLRPAVVRVCVTGYAPFVLPSSFLGLSLDALTSSIRNNLAALLVQQPSGGANLSVTGFDISFAKLVFSSMLSTPTVFIVQPSYLDLYFAVRNGACDVGVAAVEQDPNRAVCSDTCAPAGALSTSGFDYVDGFPQTLFNEVCCLAYGVSYFSSGFGLASVQSIDRANLLAALGNAQVVTTGLAILAMAIGFGWVQVLIERRSNPRFRTPADGVYWAITTYATVGYGDMVPHSHAGRCWAGLAMVTSLVSICTLTSLLSAQLTSSLLNVQSVGQLSDVTGMLCVQHDYPLLASFLQQAPARPSYLLASVEDCMAQLRDGQAQAVLADRPVLQWFALQYGWSGLVVSGAISNTPFSFVYANGSEFLGWADAAVIAAQTDPDWVPQYTAISDSYFALGSGAASVAASAAADRVMPWAVALFAAMSGATAGATAWMHHARRARAAAAAAATAAAADNFNLSDGGKGAGGASLHRHLAAVGDDEGSVRARAHTAALLEVRALAERLSELATAVARLEVHLVEQGKA